MTDVKRLVKSREDGILSGVCSGLAKYLELDPTIVRIVFVLLVFFGGSGIVLYLILWLFMPNDGQAKDVSQEDILKENVNDIQDKFNGLTKRIERADKRYLPGFALIFFAGLLILRNAGVISSVYVFPAVLLALGIYLIVRA